MREAVTAAQPQMVSANSHATYRFKLDALASAAPPGPILVDGSATFIDSGTAMSATPLVPALSLAFSSINPTLVVNTTADETTNPSERRLHLHRQEGGSDLWVTGNICVDEEYSGVIADGSDGGKLYIVDNTFVRTGRVDLAAVRRAGNRVITFRNNLCIANNPAAILSNMNAYEAISGSPLCSGSCSSATINNASLITTTPMVANSSGTSVADFTPVAGSPVIDTGIDYIDRNGSAPGRFNGIAPERGAVELP